MVMVVIQRGSIGLSIQRVVVMIRMMMMMMMMNDDYYYDFDDSPQQ
jgi:ribose/xylose/arabinose/galactoside ABC-type transport system permease subunit